MIRCQRVRGCIGVRVGIPSANAAKWMSVESVTSLAFAMAVFSSLIFYYWLVVGLDQ